MAKTALVTGAARGIGKAIARDLSRDFDVAITWHETQPDAEMQGMECIQADLGDTAQCQAVVEKTIARFGRIDLIVNNAGSVANSPLDHHDAEALRDMFDVNVFAPNALLTAALPHLAAGSSIISISSINAVLPPQGAVFFGASKAALELWTRGMAKELGPRQIRVNAIAPGAINLPEAPRPDDLVELFVKDTALGRIGTPQDVVRVVRFLASDSAAFITGEIITVSGGYKL